MQVFTEEQFTVEINELKRDTDNQYERLYKRLEYLADKYIGRVANAEDAASRHEYATALKHMSWAERALSEYTTLFGSPYYLEKEDIEFQ